MARGYQRVYATGMLSRIRRTIEDRGLLASGARILVACSGGGDSVAALHALNELGFAVEAACIDHGWRESARSEVHSVRLHCEQLGTAFHTRRLELPKGPDAHGRARSARYAALHEIAGSLGVQSIVTGHTQDDQAETVLARVLRGGGLRGMRGVLPRREDGVVRPLIDCRRDELREWLRGREVSWVEDPSNEEERFERTRMRAILAKLQTEDPQLVAHLAHLADDARRALEVVKAAARAEIPLREVPEAVRRMRLREQVIEAVGQSPGRPQLTALSKMVTRGRGEVRLAQGKTARLVEGRVVIDHTIGGRDEPT